MFDAPPTSYQRSRGDARVRLGPGGLISLRQAGSAKAMLPRTHGPEPEVVFLNTAGGLTGGDVFRFDLALEPDTRASATTQTAERAYASTTGAARVEVTLDVGEGAHLSWLPQETILFEASHLDRRTTIHLGVGASVIALETVVLGRQAMGETPEALTLTDRRRILDPDGTPLFAEGFRIDADLLANRAAPAGLAGHRAFATLVAAGPGATDAIPALRRTLADTPHAAVSAANGCLVARLAAPDAFTLRRRTIDLVTTLRQASMPRVWQV